MLHKSSSKKRKDANGGNINKRKHCVNSFQHPTPNTNISLKVQTQVRRLTIYSGKAYN